MVLGEVGGGVRVGGWGGPALPASTTTQGSVNHQAQLVFSILFGSNQSMTVGSVTSWKWAAPPPGHCGPRASPVLPSFLAVVRPPLGSSQPSKLSPWYCSRTCARLSCRSTGDWRALLQDGNFLAQLFWFRVPGWRKGGGWGGQRSGAEVRRKENVNRRHRLLH